MARYLLLCLLSISLNAWGQRCWPDSTGQQQRYTAYIELPHAYVSGICILQNEGDTIRGSIFNEFGITALDFAYLQHRDKVRLHSVIKMIDHWYIRRQLCRDLRQLIHCLQKGENNYYNKKYKITYTLTPLP